MSYKGFYIHTNSFTICRLDADGSAASVGWLCLSLDAGDKLALAATGNSVWRCDEVRPCLDRIVVVNPGRFQMIRQSVKKTDRKNARALAFLLSKDMLPEMHLESLAEAELASLVQIRDSFVKSRTLLLNSIHALYDRRGTEIKKKGLASQKKLFALDAHQFTPLECAELDSLREQTLNLTIALTNLDSAIKAATEKMDDFDRLTSIKSVAARSTAILLQVIGNADNLANADRLAAYIGVVPRDSRWGIKERRGSGKAIIIATARKLLTIIYDAFKNRWVFDGFTQFKIKQSQLYNGQLLLGVQHG